MTGDLWEEKCIVPMLLYEVEPFDDPEYLYELKLDGIRAIAYLDKDGATIRNKRNKDVTDLYPELSDIGKCVRKRCILDGELVVLKGGKPDFFALQKRSLTTDRFRIKLASERVRVQFVCYDILYLGAEAVTGLPLCERKRLLLENVTDGNGMSVSRYVEGEGVRFFELAKREGLEGIVAKKKDGLYHIGKRTRDWVKIKVMQDEDLIVCGYRENDEGGIKDLVLGLYENGTLVTRGSVSLGISKSDEKTIMGFAKQNQVKTAWFPEKKDVVWLKPELVGTAHYMHKTENGHMRQPVWRGLRDDKAPEDCGIGGA